MNKSVLVLVFLGAFSFVGCGNDKNDGNVGYSTFQSEVMPAQGFCAPEVVDAYNGFAYACNNMSSDFNTQICRMKAQGFVHTYPNISCLAGLANNQGNYYNPQFNGQWQGQASLHITTTPMRQILAVLGTPDWQRNYRPWPRGRRFR